jgi:predicted PurR-regulated permease PerM
MQTMTVRGSPILRYMLAAAAIVVMVIGLKYASDFLAPVFFATTLAILFTPALRPLEKRKDCLPGWRSWLWCLLLGCSSSL